MIYSLLFRSNYSKLIIILFAIGSGISLSPILPDDFWWHLKAGQLIAGQNFPRTNLFTWTLPPETPYTYQSWLSELIFHRFYSLGGLPLIVFLRNVLALATLGFVAYITVRRSNSWRYAAIAVLLAAGLMSNALTARPQNWSWLACAIVALILSDVAAQRMPIGRLAVLPVILLMWVNTHGAFVLGLILICVYAIGETLQVALGRSQALDRRSLYILYSVALLSFGATLLNPSGWGIYNYVYSLSTNAFIRGFVSEWQAPNPTTLIGISFFAVLAGTTVALWWGRQRLRISDIVVSVAFAYLACTSIRNIVWFAIVVLPIAAQALASPVRLALPRRQADTKSPRLRSTGRPLATPASNKPVPLIARGLLALSFALFLVVQPWTKHWLPLPAAYRAQFVDLHNAPLLASRDTPVAATEHLRAIPCQGKLFNDQVYGSYLEWALYPQTQVFVDTRIELYPPAVWHDYVTISQGRDLYTLLDQKYAIACVMLDHERQPGLSAVLAHSPLWERTFPAPGVTTNEPSEVWRRRL